MKSVVVHIRLNTSEVDKLREMRCSDVSGDKNVCEFFRLLLAREWNRRKGLGKVVASDWQTDFRQKKTISPLLSKRQGAEQETSLGTNK